ncbi:unnamed protein product [Rangifer tarandus platyrhynchus]|uniref:Uncharacterized protein n=2 Tax=Rangifer tarandus platyrhynchus TaxID=3082113 RepID=A0ABN8XXM4_RANTA|nr:unnamed protein product [Rangifer tarandus platyrhynchus]
MKTKNAMYIHTLPAESVYFVESLVRPRKLKPQALLPFCPSLLLRNLIALQVLLQDSTDVCSLSHSLPPTLQTHKLALTQATRHWRPSPGCQQDPPRRCSGPSPSGFGSPSEP